jgi:hypothetical protein
LAPSRVFDSAARHPSADAIAQFGQRMIIAVRPNLNFTKTISNGLRQCGQQSGSSLMLLIKLPKPAAGTGNADYYFFPIMSFVFAVPSLTCDREREGIYAAIRSAG